MSVSREVIANVQKVEEDYVRCETCKYYKRRGMIVSIIGCSFWDSADIAKYDFLHILERYER